jgi:NitT/TauT family transport system substrate-binding protein
VPKPIDIHIGRRIEGRRRELRISAPDLARALRISRKRLRAIETGAARSRPRELAAIAELLTAPIFHFFDGYEAPKEQGEREAMLGRSLILSAYVASVASVAAAEPSDLTIVRSRSLASLPLIVMQDLRLVEKHARAQGIGDITVSYRTLGGGAAANDALLSNSAQFIAAGVAPFLTLWDRTRGAVAVKAVSALNTTPAYLVTRNPKVHSVADFSDTDRINVVAPKVAVQAILLQIAAAKAFGASDYSRLDKLTIGLPTADGSAALMAGVGDITADFALPPFAYQELDTPGLHLVLRSDELLGGPTTDTMLYTTTAFYDANPRTVAAVTAALEEAIELIRKDRSWASEVFMHVEGRSPQVPRMVEDPTITFGREPHNIMKYADFMHSTGMLRNAPPSWRDLFFEREAQAIHDGN